MFFDGKFKSRQNVSLRGESKTEQKDDLLIKTQLAREQRELFRKRTKAATAIQAFTRGKKDLQVYKHHQRNLYDEESKQLRDLGVNQERTLLLLRRLNFFFRPGLDDQRYIFLATLLIEEAAASSSKHFFPLNEANLSTWKTPIKALVRVSFGAACHPATSTPARHMAASLLDTLVVFPTPANLFIGTTISWGALTSPWLAASLAPIKAYWIQTENADLAITALFTQVLSKLIEEHSALLKSQGGSKGADSRFILDILSIPHLNHKLGPGWGHFVAKFPLELVLVLVNSSLTAWVNSLPPQKANEAFAPQIYCVANLLVLAVARLPKMPLQFLSIYCQVLGRFIAYLPEHIFVSSRLPSVVDEAIDEDDMDVDTPAPKPTDPRLYQSLRLLYSGDHINQLIKLLPQKPSSELSAEEEKRLVSLFSVLHEVVFRFKEVQFDTLNIMAFGSGVKFFVKHLWKMINTHMVYRSYVESTKDYLLNPSTQPEFWTHFSLFVAVFGHVLTTLSDEEFFNGDSVVPIPEIVGLISVIKSMLSKAFKSEFQVADSNPVAGSVNFATLKAMFVKFMKHLHDRDTRRKFCPENHWIAKIDLSLDNVSAQFLDMFDQREATDDEVLQDQFRAMNEGDEDALLEYMMMPKPPSVLMNSQSQRAAENAIALLKNIPFVVPFEDRVAVFRQLINRDRQVSFKSSHHVEVRRSKTFDDGFEKLGQLGKNIKGKLRITFVDDYGIQEAGIDGGGVFKEFMNEIIKSGFNPSYGLFKATETQTIYPDPKALFGNANAQKQFEFLGRLVGKSLYTGILVELPFAGFFLNKLLGRNNYLDDLNSLDPQLYRNLLYVKHYSGNVEDLSLYFCMTDGAGGQDIELVPGGKNILVTNKNRMEYIYRMAYFKLNTQISQGCSAFLNGMSDMINLSWLKLFDQEELQTLISGARAPVNLLDLRRNTHYASPFSDSHQTIQWFWEAVSSFTEEEKRLLLQFVTSCSRPPLLGFSELNPKFSVNPVMDIDRLPTASTCANLLKLPVYTSYAKLREKLLYSIHSKAGFDLS